MTSSSGPPGKRLRHHIPVRLRHYWKAVVVTIAFLSVLVGVFGTGMVRPYTTSSAAAVEPEIIQNIAGTKDLFDTSVAHDVTIHFNEANYQKMLKEYFDSGEKDYLPATVVIDGTTIDNVGIRLKGNSTLASLTWNGQRRQGGRGGGPGGERPPGIGDVPGGMQLPEGLPQPGGRQPGGPGGMPGGGMGGELKAEEPESLPWLINFDEYVDGRRYQGHTQIAVRPGTTESSAQLNESLAISVVNASGEPSQRYTYSGLAVNGRTSTPRLLVEYLDEGYASGLGNGALYKALASGQFAYQGGDQTEYGDDFKQINDVGGTDLQPVINLIKWVEDASDEEFDAGLPERLEVASFARYLALQNIVMNFDDMAGPGKNYYLWYDLETRKFTVVSWDLNLAFSGDTEAGPHDTSRMGPGGPGGGRMPDGGAPSDGGQVPGGAGPPDGAQPPGGARMMGNKLKDRFLASSKFKTLYEEQYRQVYAATLAGGQAEKSLATIVDSYARNVGADQSVRTEADSLRTLLRQRVSALDADEVVRGQ
ncbi:CotH kinase family protein [Amycolatopsis thailandensis]|uniref:CotH kinase family protein n=1 Tax=Amycolatopsis thailandensis TaxID=589330 RepID=UPI0036539A8A